MSSVYYTEPIFFFTSDENGKELQNDWNYVVIGSGLESSEAQDKLISDVGGLDFVKTYAGYRVTSGGDGGLDAAGLNKIMKVQALFFIRKLVVFLALTFLNIFSPFKY